MNLLFNFKLNICFKTSSDRLSTGKGEAHFGIFIFSSCDHRSGEKSSIWMKIFDFISFQLKLIDEDDENDTHRPTNLAIKVSIYFSPISRLFYHDFYWMQSNDRRLFWTKNFRLQEIIRHPEYSQITRKNDIALVRVSSIIQFSSEIWPACLHTDLRDERRDVKV